MGDLFFQEKGKNILLSLGKGEKSYISGVARDINGTYAHTFNLIKEMEGQGIVSTSKEGRTKYISLTPRGKDLADILSEFIAVLEGGKRKAKKTVKKVAENGTTPTQEKLEIYQKKIEKLRKETSAGRLDKAQRAKFKRLCGRYKSLILRLRPRDNLGKKSKTDLISELNEINKVLEK
jgi:predicted transcriptional regulator